MEQKLKTDFEISTDGFSSPAGFMSMFEPGTHLYKDPMRELSKTKSSHDQDTTKESTPIVLPTVLTKAHQTSLAKTSLRSASKSFHVVPKMISQLTETDFASSSPDSCFKPILALNPDTDNDVFKSKVEALAGCAVGPEQSRCFELALVREMLSGLVEELCKPNVQRKLQKLLIDSRNTQQTIVQDYAEAFCGSRFTQIDGSLARVPGRFEICQYASEEALANMGMPKTSATSVWKVIARFAFDGEVMSSLSIVDELLALPPNSTSKAIVDPTRSYCESCPSWNALASSKAPVKGRSSPTTSVEAKPSSESSAESGVPPKNPDKSNSVSAIGHGARQKLVKDVKAEA